MQSKLNTKKNVNLNLMIYLETTKSKVLKAVEEEVYDMVLSKS